MLIDRNSKKYNDIVNLIEKYRKDDELNVSHFISEGTGPACLAHEIRDLFLNYAEPDDLPALLNSKDVTFDDVIHACGL